MEKRIFGATDGIRGKVGEAPLRPNIIKELGRAIAKNTYAKKVLLGRDTRESGIWMAEQITDGASAAGAEVENFAKPDARNNPETGVKKVSPVMELVKTLKKNIKKQYIEE
jgi:phosphomannomutase